MPAENLSKTSETDFLMEIDFALDIPLHEEFDIS